MLGCNETITLYNRYGSGRGEGWMRIVLTGVSWFGRQVLAVSKDGMATADSVVVRIPACVPGYVPPDAWDPAGGGWTLKKGDVLVRGVCQAEIAPGESISKALGGGLETTAILSLADNRMGLLPHFRVGGGG